MKHRFFAIIGIAVGILLSLPAYSIDIPEWLRLRRNGATSAPESRHSLAAERDSLLLLVSRLQSMNDSLSLSLDRSHSEVDSLMNFPGMATLRVELSYSESRVDSLLDYWTAVSFARDAFDSGINVVDETEKLTTMVPDSVYIKRLERMNAFIGVPYNYVVKSQIVNYAERYKNKMGVILGLYHYYAPAFNEIFDRYGVPEEVKAMAIIESMMNPLASSPAGAKGMWQFMYSTAKIYGLEISSFVDERLDPYASCEATAKFMVDSYRTFGDWSLAIATYNCGLGNVKKAIRRAGGKTAFWDIYPFLPRETRNYLPAFVGALYTINYAGEHGIEPVQVTLDAQTDTFLIHKMLHFQQVADLTGASVEEIKKYNPQYKHSIIPGSEGGHTLRLPRQYAMAFIDNETIIYDHRSGELLSEQVIKKAKSQGDGSYIIYKVKSGDNLSTIAAHYPGVSAKDIMRFNGIGTMIRPGQKLRIPIR